MGHESAFLLGRLRSVAVAAGLAAMLLCQVHRALAHGAEMMLGSTAQGGGALALDYDFADQAVVSKAVSIGGMTLYTELLPGIEWLDQDQAEPPLFAICRSGTPFSMRIVSIDPGAAVMVGATTLNAAGQSAPVTCID